MSFESLIEKAAANNWFAEQLVRDLGADEARNRTCG